MKSKPKFAWISLALWLAALLLLTGLLGAPAVRAASGPSMQVRAGFDNYYKLNSWLPVRVDLSLPQGSPNFDGWLEASFTNFDQGSTLYRRAVQLTAPANRQVWLYLPTGNRNLREVQLRLTAQDGALVDTKALAIQPLDQSDLLVGVISDNPGALSVLNGLQITQAYNKGSLIYAVNYYSRAAAAGIKPAVRVAHISPADLPPDASGWDSLDGLALSGLSNLNVATLTQDTANLESAAAAWLAQGRFIFAAGDNSLRLGGFLAGFLPVKAGGPPLTKAFPDQLRAIMTEPTAPTRLLLADTTLLPGASAQLMLEGTPLLAEKPFGLGRTWFSATDLETLPPSVVVLLWQVACQDYEPHLSFMGGLRQPVVPFDLWTSRLNPNDQAATLPDVVIIGLILGVYVLLLGPLGYFGLKKWGKLEWGWLAVPLLVVGLTGGFYLAGVVTGGEPLAISRLSVVMLGETAQGKMVGGATSLGTIYSAGRQSVEVNLADQTQAVALARSDNTLNLSNDPAAPDFTSIRQGPGGGFGSVYLGQDDQRSFTLESKVPTQIGEGIVANLSSPGIELNGTLENRSQIDWHNLSVWKSGNLIYRIPLLKAGEKITLQKSHVVDNKSDSLALVLAGIANGQGGTSNSVLFFGPPEYQTREVMVLSTLIGSEGQVLPRGTNRAFLLAWNQAAFNFPLQPGNQKTTTQDLTMLFEPLAVS